MARKKGFLLRILDGIVLAATFGAAAALLCAYLAPAVDPNRIWLFAYAGLVAPVLYIVNLLLMLYWAVRWKKVFFVPLAALLIGLPKIDEYYRGSREKPVDIQANETIKILTYNVEGFMQYEGGRRTSSARQIAELIRERDPNILCFQEFQTTPGMPLAAVDALLGEWPHRKIYHTSRNYGSAIYSKFPILRSEVLEIAGARKGVLWADVLAGGDTIRIVCNHLESTNIQEEDIDFLRPENFAEDPDKGGRIRTIAGRLRRGFRTRAVQADTVAALIASGDGPTVVCGDFNDPPMSHTYRTIRGDFNDAFVEAGSGYGYTYKKLYRLLRIDYILPSPHFETLSYDSPDVPWSDHNPVIAVIRKKE